MIKQESKVSLHPRVGKAKLPMHKVITRHKTKSPNMENAQVQQRQTYLLVYGEGTLAQCSVGTHLVSRVTAAGHLCVQVDVPVEMPVSIAQLARPFHWGL